METKATNDQLAAKASPPAKQSSAALAAQAKDPPIPQKTAPILQKAIPVKKAPPTAVQARVLLASIYTACTSGLVSSAVLDPSGNGGILVENSEIELLYSDIPR